MRKTTAGYALLLLFIIAAIAYAALTDNHDGTIADSTNALLWSKHFDANISYTDASTSADNFQAGGFGDWRLPTQSELETLIDTTGTYYPKINPMFNLGAHPIRDWTFWSSTQDPNANDYVPGLQDRYVAVSFDTGETLTAFKTQHFSARYVRPDTPVDNPVEWDASGDQVLWTDGGDIVEWH